MSECEYCQQDKPLRQTESGTLMLIDNKLIGYVAWDDYNDCPSGKVLVSEIRYCPMCGRKLGEQLMNEFETKITNVTADLADTLIAKNHDYGNSFGDLVKEYGDLAMLIPIKNKVNRLDTLIKTDGKVKNESIEDTLRDLAGYAILSLIELDSHKPATVDEVKLRFEKANQQHPNFPLPK